MKEESYVFVFLTPQGIYILGAFCFKEQAYEKN